MCCSCAARTKNGNLQSLLTRPVSCCFMPLWNGSSTNSSSFQLQVGIEFPRCTFKNLQQANFVQLLCKLQMLLSSEWTALCASIWLTARLHEKLQKCKPMATKLVQIEILFRSNGVKLVVSRFRQISPRHLQEVQCIELATAQQTLIHFRTRNS